MGAGQSAVGLGHHSRRSVQAEIQRVLLPAGCPKEVFDVDPQISEGDGEIRGGAGVPLEPDRVIIRGRHIICVHPRPGGIKVGQIPVGERDGLAAPVVAGRLQGGQVERELSRPTAYCKVINLALAGGEALAIDQRQVVQALAGEHLERLLAGGPDQQVVRRRPAVPHGVGRSGRLVELGAGPIIVPAGAIGVNRSVDEPGILAVHDVRGVDKVVVGGPRPEVSHQLEVARRGVQAVIDRQVIGVPGLQGEGDIVGGVVPQPDQIVQAGALPDVEFFVQG